MPQGLPQRNITTSATAVVSNILLATPKEGLVKVRVSGETIMELVRFPMGSQTRSVLEDRRSHFEGLNQ